MSGLPEASRASRHRQTRPPAAMKTKAISSKADKKVLAASTALWPDAELSHKRADNVSTTPARAIPVVFQ